MTTVRGMVSKGGRTCVMGPGKEGPHPPGTVRSSAFLTIQVLFIGLKDYQQSESLDLYQSYTKKLLEVIPPEFDVMKIHCFYLDINT